jgi:hypothetical protein
MHCKCIACNTHDSRSIACNALAVHACSLPLSFPPLSLSLSNLIYDLYGIVMTGKCSYTYPSVSPSFGGNQEILTEGEGSVQLTSLLRSFL